MNKFSYEIKLDIEKDAWNWFEACNKTSHGVNWKMRVDDEIVERLCGVDRDAAYEILIPFLQNKYNIEKKSIKSYKDYIYDKFNKKFTPACVKLEEITQHPLYRGDFIIYLTTFPRGPYNFNNGELWITIGRMFPLKNFMHEVLHFQFIKYWRMNEKSAVHDLSNEEFDYLKESLTVVLDEEMLDIIGEADKGYDMHLNFRKKLHDYWATNKDFEKLVKFGLDNLKKYM